MASDREALNEGKLELIYKYLEKKESTLFDQSNRPEEEGRMRKLDSVLRLNTIYSSALSPLNYSVAAVIVGCRIGTESFPCKLTSTRACIRKWSMCVQIIKDLKFLAEEPVS